MKNLISLVLFLAGAGLMYQCSDIFDPNLSKSKYSVTLISPADSISTEIQTQTFMWEPVKGATKYEFQLAYPSFDKPEIILVDSIVTGTSFVYTFNFTGNYQWRVQAKNSSSHTSYYKRSLHVKKVLSLSKQTLFLYGPADSLYTNDDNISISWKKIAVAKQYLFTLQQNDSKGKYIVEQEETTDQKITLPLPGFSLSEGTYFWTITATNDTSESATVGRTFIIDRTAPSAPTLLTPKADTVLLDTTSVQIKFTWVRPGTDVVYDSIYILDSNKTTVLFKAKTASLVFNYPSPWSSYAKYWKVKSFDKAGNASGNSEIRKYSFKKK